MLAERRRLLEDARRERPWKRWGPYLSERQWGTVREDYSRDGNAWDYISHEAARMRAYRWGEDGLAGVSDELCRLCLAVALWNGRDPILKERLFGLTNAQGNHGEDVKELYYYLDATPSHSYLKYLYKYPQREFPYAQLADESRRRGKDQPEFELFDAHLFADGRYFDVFVEYAQAEPDDLRMRLTVFNRGPEAARLVVLPTLWFRNTWSWNEDLPRPEVNLRGPDVVAAEHHRLGTYLWQVAGAEEFLFTENDTNVPRLFGRADVKGYWKDAFHEAIVHGRRDAVSPEPTGTKAAAVARWELPPGGSATLRLRLAREALAAANGSGNPAEAAAFDALLAERIAEADAFYADVQRDLADEDARRVQRQALAGMIWTKQFYHWDVSRWLHGDPTQPPPPVERRSGRNADWTHFNAAEILSMPDKWEYPWFAAWDTAFHCLPLALIDPAFAKEQLILLAREWYMHPNGQLPAYEWCLSDVNPPVHAWAAWRVFQIDRKQRGDCGDLAFLERVFHKLLLNFTWWVNRKDVAGRNVFQGGFLGLDNIGVFDRSRPLPTGGYLNQSDGTSWMAMYSLNLMRIALELAVHNPAYQDIATKFFEHFLYIAKAMTNMGGEGVGLWDDKDKFYYDELNLPDGRILLLKIRSLVGLIPLFAVEVLEPELLERVPEFTRRLQWFLNYRPDLAQLVSRWHEPGRGERRLLSLLRGHRMKRLLARMLDPAEFLSDYGVRSLSRHHLEHPYVFQLDGQEHRVQYTPAESNTNLFGGNSNWRGPVWFPVNYLIVESLQRFHHYYGDDFRVECPTGSGQMVSILDVARELARRLESIFLRDAAGRRPVFGDCPLLQTDPHFRDYLLFYEYFDGDNGRGCGASHQTGWTGLVAKLLQPRREDLIVCPPSDPAPSPAQ